MKTKEEKALCAKLHSTVQQCVACGRTVSVFDIHRMVRGSHNGKYEISNLAILCKNCHMKLHSSPSQFKKDNSEDLYYKLLPSLKGKRDYKKALEDLNDSIERGYNYEPET